MTRRTPSRVKKEHRQVHEYNGQILMQYQARISVLLGQIEVGDDMIAQQRELLIRLTEIKNNAQDLIAAFRSLWHGSKFTTELGGTVWLRVHGITAVEKIGQGLSYKIAALEVDSALPKPEGAKEPRP